MAASLLSAALLLLGASPSSGVAASQAMFERAFDPELNFAGEIRPSSDDQLLLTAVASARDDYAPDYSLAIAYLCRTREGDTKSCYGQLTARVLRVASREPEQTSASLGLVARVRRGSARRVLPAALAAGEIEWLEADVFACSGALAAFDQVRLADWRPDLYYALQRMEDRDVNLHPAELRVRMTGSYASSQWRGWRNAAGVPAAVARLVEVLEPCWSPAKVPPPWRRR